MRPSPRRAPRRERLPLYGIPFAVKDNIDVAGLPTTAACPAFAYVPERSAHVVERLEQAGAILIGKTNLDQFATGLVGTRSPYGAPRERVRSATTSPAARAPARRSRSRRASSPSRSAPTPPARAACRPRFNNIVGLKPTQGLISTRGVVPACRTLDCVSIFAADRRRRGDGAQ